MAFCAKDVERMAKIALNDGFVPKYMQIRDYLMNKIRMGELGQGEMIPSEWELARQFNVSRITAVKAVKELETRFSHSRTRTRNICL